MFFRLLSAKENVANMRKNSDIRSRETCSLLGHPWKWTNSLNWIMNAVDCSSFSLT